MKQPRTGIIGMDQVITTANIKQLEKRSQALYFSNLEYNQFVLAGLIGIVNKSNMRLVNLSKIQLSGHNQQIKEQSLKVTLEGPSSGLLMFINNLKHYGKVVRIQDLSYVTSSSKSKDQAKIEIKLSCLIRER